MPEEARALSEAPETSEPTRHDVAATVPGPVPEPSASPPRQPTPAHEVESPPVPQFPSFEVGPFLFALRESWAGGLVAGLLPVLIAYVMGLYGALRIREALGPDWAELSGLLPIAKLAGLLATGVLGLPVEIAASTELLGFGVGGSATISGAFIGLIVLAMLGAVVAAWSWSRRRTSSFASFWAYLLVAVVSFALGTALVSSVASVDQLGLTVTPQAASLLSVLALAAAVTIGYLPSLRAVAQRETSPPAVRGVIDGVAGAGWAMSFTVIAFLSFFVAFAVVAGTSATDSAGTDLSVEETPPITDLISLAAVGSAQAVGTSLGPLHGGTLAATVDVAALDLAATYTTSVLDFPELDGAGLGLAPWFVLIGVLIGVAAGAFGLAMSQRGPEGRTSSGITIISLGASYAVAVAIASGLASLTVDGRISVDGESFAGMLRLGPGPAPAFVGALVLVGIGAFAARAALRAVPTGAVTSATLVIGAGLVALGVVGWSGAIEEVDSDALLAGVDSDQGLFGSQVSEDFDEISSSLGGRSVLLFDLHLGDCFNDPSFSSGPVEVELVDCQTPHDNEVFAILPLDVSVYPGEPAMEDYADVECVNRFEDYVGIDYSASAIFYSAVVPSEATWEQGDHHIVCFAYEPFERLIGSVENARR